MTVQKKKRFLQSDLRFLEQNATRIALETFCSKLFLREQFFRRAYAIIRVILFFCEIFAVSVIKSVTPKQIEARQKISFPGTPCYLSAKVSFLGTFYESQSFGDSS